MARDRGVTKALALALTLAICSLGMATAQRASAEGIVSGATQFELSRGLFKALKKDGVRLSKVGTGTVAGRFVTLPVFDGQIDFGSGSGSFASDGGFRLGAGKRRVKVTRLTVETLRGTLRATVNGTKLMLAAIPHHDFAREGFGDAIASSGLHLTPRASTLLNRKLGLDVFRPDRAFGSFSASLQPGEAQVLGGSVRFEFDSDFAAKVKSLGFEVQPMESTGGPTDPPVFSAPLLAGSIDPGRTRTWGMAEGGFRITNPEGPGPTVDWWNLGLSFETGKLITSGLAHNEFGQLTPAPPQPLAALDPAGTQLTIDPTYRTVSITSAATLEAAAASYINQVFAIDRGKAPVFAAGDRLGWISLTMQGR